MMNPWLRETHRYNSFVLLQSFPIVKCNTYHAGLTEINAPGNVLSIMSVAER